MWFDVVTHTKRTRKSGKESAEMELPVAVEPRLLVFPQKRVGFSRGVRRVLLLKNHTHTHTHTRNSPSSSCNLFKNFLLYLVVYIFVCQKFIATRVRKNRIGESIHSCYVLFDIYIFFLFCKNLERRLSVGFT